MVKEKKMKVQVAIQGDKLRVTGKKRDEQQQGEQEDEKERGQISVLEDKLESVWARGKGFQLQARQLGPIAEHKMLMRSGCTTVDGRDGSSEPSGVPSS